MICVDCGALMTDEESLFYESRCEDCEREWSKRIEQWRYGKEDKELSEAFSVENVLH